mgnify:FL=1
MTTWLGKMNQAINECIEAKELFGTGAQETICLCRRVSNVRKDAQSVISGELSPDVFTYTGDPKEAIDRWHAYTVGR